MVPTMNVVPKSRLTVDEFRRVVVHHARGADDLILTRIASTGMLKLDPPGRQLDIAGIYA